MLAQCNSSLLTVGGAQTQHPKHPHPQRLFYVSLIDVDQQICYCDCCKAEHEDFLQTHTHTEIHCRYNTLLKM